MRYGVFGSAFVQRLSVASGCTASVLFVSTLAFNWRDFFGGAVVYELFRALVIALTLGLLAGSIASSVIKQVHWRLIIVAQVISYAVLSFVTYLTN